MYVTVGKDILKRGEYGQEAHQAEEEKSGESKCYTIFMTINPLRSQQHNHFTYKLTHGF